MTLDKSKALNYEVRGVMRVRTMKGKKWGVHRKSISSIILSRTLSRSSTFGKLNDTILGGEIGIGVRGA